MGIMLLSYLEAFAHHTLSLYFRKKVPLDYLPVCRAKSLPWFLFHLKPSFCLSKGGTV